LETKRLVTPRASTLEGRTLLCKDAFDIERTGSPAGLALVPASAKHVCVEFVQMPALLPKS
jgi:hypothetical protein